MKKTLVVILCFLIVSFLIPNYAGIGSVTIDGKIYNQISMRPEYNFGKVGLGLDLYFYIDDEGNFYDKAWDFSGNKALETILDKIYYLKYNNPGDNFYFKIGGVSGFTLGYGIVVDNYSNMVEYPNIRRLGMDMQLNLGKGIRTQIMVSDFKRTPGLVALRTEFPLFPRIDIGVFVATDLDMAQGLIDTDDDGYPDNFDDFPNDEAAHNKAEQTAIDNGWNEDEGLCSLGVADGTYSDLDDCYLVNLPNYYNTFERGVTVPEDNISSIGLDLSLKITRNFSVYSQFAQMIGDKIENGSYSENLGWGTVPVGFQYSVGPQKFKLNTTLETRLNSRHFMYSFWDQTYDLNRAEIVGENSVITKREQLADFGELRGVFFGSNLSMLNLLDFDVSYQHMIGETWNIEAEDFDDDKENKSFLASIKLNTSKIPKLKVAELYYHRNNDKDPFDFDNPSTNTMHGYNVGMELSNGVVLLYKGQTTYINDIDNPGEVIPNFNLQVETQIAL